MPICSCYWLTPKNLLLFCYSLAWTFDLNSLGITGFVPVILNALCGAQLCFLPGAHLAPDRTSDAWLVLLSLTERRSLGLPQQPTACCSPCWAGPAVALAGSHSQLSSPGLINLVLGSCSVGSILACPGLVQPWHWRGLHNPHLSSRDSLCLSQPPPKRQPPLPFLDLWFTHYSSTLPQLPWQQHTLGPAGKIPHSDLAPVPGSRQAQTAGRTQAWWIRYWTDWSNSGVPLHKSGLQSRVKKMTSFLSSVSNKSLHPRTASAWQADTQMISDGLRADRKASLSTANSAPTENPFSGDERCCSKPQRAGMCPLLALACSSSEQWSAGSGEPRHGLSVQEMSVLALKSETWTEMWPWKSCSSKADKNVPESSSTVCLITPILRMANDLPS